MSSGIIKPTIPLLDGVNYQSWKSVMKSFLRFIDLWLLTGETGAARVNQPGYADPNAPTIEETRAIQAWDTADSRSQGILYLHMTEPAKQRVEAGVGAASTACLVWE